MMAGYNSPGYDYPRMPNPVYSSEGIDQLILTPDGKATTAIMKRPKIIRKPIFLLDEAGEKVPLLDEKGNQLINEFGELMYVVKDYLEEQDGWEPVQENMSTSELFTIDGSTSNISHEAVQVVLASYWFHNRLAMRNANTNKNFSGYLHKLRNDTLAIFHASKSLNGGTVQSIKTFINKTDARQWTNEMEEKKPGILGNLFGGNKQKKPEEKEYTAYK